VVEDLAYCRLLEYLANKRNGRCNVWLHYVPWYLVLPASIHGLQLVIYFSEVYGMLVDVFWAIVYLRPLTRHYHKIHAFSRVTCNNCLFRTTELSYSVSATPMAVVAA
jgi:hypothetical protein